MQTEVSSIRKLWGIKALAAELGMDRQTVRNRIADCPSDGEIQGYPAWYLKTVVRSLIAPVSELEGNIQANLNPDLMKPSDREDFYSSELKRIKLEQELGLLIKSEVYAKELGEVLKTVAGSLSGIADILERDAGLNLTQVDIVVDIIDELRQSMFDKIVSIESESNESN